MIAAELEVPIAVVVASAALVRGCQRRKYKIGPEETIRPTTWLMDEAVDDDTFSQEMEESLEPYMLRSRSIWKLWT